MAQSQAVSKPQKQPHKGKPKSVRPNYFVSVRVSSPEIHQSIAKLQQQLVDHHSSYSKTLIPLPTLHLTTLLLALNNDKEVQAAQQAFQNSRSELLKILSEHLKFDKLALSLTPSQTSASDALTDLTPLSSLSSSPNSAASFPFHLQFEGVSHFSHKVLYASLCEDSAVKFLRAVSAVMARSMIDAGVVITNSKELLSSEAKAAEAKGSEVTEDVEAPAAGEKRPSSRRRRTEAKGFTPHLTIAKFSRTFPKRSHHKFKKRRNEAMSKEAGKAPDEQQQQTEETGDQEGDQENPSQSVSNSVPAADSKLDESDIDEKEESRASNPETATSQPQLPLPTKFVPETYQSFLSHRFGTQPILTFDLCSMQHKKQEDGYYHVISSITLSSEEEAPAETAPSAREVKSIVSSVTNEASQESTAQT